MCEEFCRNQNVIDGVTKLLVSSLSVEELVQPSLCLLGALSTHQTGCTLIVDTGMLTIFSQMFLSSSLEPTTSLAILRNLAERRCDIPQVSLIISCLMQDLMYSRQYKPLILKTLRQLVNNAPTAIQEHDIQTSILAMLQPRETPVTIVLALELIEVVDSSKLRTLYQHIALKIYAILKDPTMMYPQLIAAAVKTLMTLSFVFDIKGFLKITGFVDLVEYVAAATEQGLPEVHNQIQDALYFLKQAAPAEQAAEAEQRFTSWLAPSEDLNE
jgi:hypothetical protein